MISIKTPYLLFLADHSDPTYAKTAFGVRDWNPQDCLAQWRMENGKVDLGLPFLTPKEAYTQGARSLLIGVAPVGGAIPNAWVPYIVDALKAGLDIVSGMHQRLSDIPDIAEAAKTYDRDLHDVRHSTQKLPIGSGEKRSGKRLLTVGTDCALGKKYTALALTKALRERGIKADFRATGQTGIMISGSGIAIDAVVADFLAGAAETLSPDNTADHWDVIEGQGSLFHPSYAGVTVGLLHGSQPDAIILCHDPSRTSIVGHPNHPIPDLRDAIDLYLRVGAVTNTNITCVGIALNTSMMSDADAAAKMQEISDYVGLPCFDPIRGGIDTVVDRVESMTCAA